MHTHSVRCITASYINGHARVFGLTGFTDILVKMALLSRLFQARMVRVRTVISLLSTTIVALRRAYLSPTEVTMAGEYYVQLERDFQKARSAALANPACKGSYMFNGVALEYSHDGQQYT